MALLAQVYANQGQLAEAQAWCEKAIAADKLNASHHYLQAIIQQEQKRTDDAVLSLKRALYLDPDFVMAHVALANLTQRQGKRRVARKHFVNALSLLDACPRETILPESGGMTAGRLVEIIRSTMDERRPA